MTISVLTKDWKLLAQYATVAEVLAKYGGLESQVESALKTHAYYQGLRIWLTADIPAYVYTLLRDRESEILDTLTSEVDKSDDELLDALAQIDILRVETNEAKSSEKQLQETLATLTKTYDREKAARIKTDKDYSDLLNDLEVEKKNGESYLIELEEVTAQKQKYEATLKAVYKQLTGKVYKGPVKPTEVDTNDSQTVTTNTSDKVNNSKESIQFPKVPLQTTDTTEDDSTLTKSSKQAQKPLNIPKKTPQRRVSFDWETSVKDPNFPLGKDLKKTKQWHFRQLSGKLGLTEKQLSVIFQKVLQPLDYTRDFSNENMMSTAEVVLIAFSVYSLDQKDKANKGVKVLDQVKLLYPSWLDKKDLIKDWVSQL